MTLSLFAGIAVSDLKASIEWYERLFGAPPSFFPKDVEAVWQLEPNRFVYVKRFPEHAGHAMQTMIVDDLDALMAALAGRGLEPADLETYDNGVRKAIYRDPDGNELGFGAVPR